MMNLSGLLLVLLLGSLHLASSAPFVNSPDCCVKLTDVKIPLRRLESYGWTSSDCAFKAIVFKTVKGLKFCVDPDTEWVSGHVEALDKLMQ